MTSRRSFRPWTQRLSQAQQFRPGHVTGRVASAQPLRRRTRLGEVEERVVEVGGLLDEADPPEAGEP